MYTIIVKARRQNMATKALETATPRSEREWLDDVALAAVLGLSVKAVRQWRLLGKGPKYRKFGSAVRYGRPDLEAWISSQPHGGEAVTA